jgi:hypothetical protein
VPHLWWLVVPQLVRDDLMDRQVQGGVDDPPVHDDLVVVPVQRVGQLGVFLLEQLTPVRSRLLSSVSSTAGRHEADEPAATASDKGLLDGRFLLLMGVTFGAGLGLGGCELAMVAFSDQTAGPAQAGALLAALSLGSALGGALYGTRDWSGTAFRHLVACCLALGLGLGLLALIARSTSLLGFVTVGFLLGLFVAPLIVALYTCADDLVTAGTRTQASTLVGTLNNLGTAAGTAATGILLGASGVGQALLLGASVMLATGLLALRVPVAKREGANSVNPPPLPVPGAVRRYRAPSSRDMSRGRVTLRLTTEELALLHQALDELERQDERGGASGLRAGLEQPKRGVGSAAQQQRQPRP